MAQPTKTQPSKTSGVSHGVRHAAVGNAANLEIGRAVYDAFNQRQFDRALALCDEKCVISVIPTGQSYRGPNGMREFMQGWVNALPNCQVALRHQYATETGVVNEFHGHGVHSGVLKTQQGNIGPTQKTLDLDFCEVWEITDGKIQSIRAYFDVATMMRQLGLQK